MAGVYLKQPAAGEKIVSQCNGARDRKAAIQNPANLTSAAYNLVLEWLHSDRCGVRHHRNSRSSPHTQLEKESTMKRSHKIATAVALAFGLGLAGGAYAHPGQMGSGMGEGMHGGMQHGMHGGMQHGTKSGHEGRRAMSQLMTPEEREAFREKMRSAKTRDERRQIAQANRAEMQKRAEEKGITLPEHRGPRGRRGAGPAAAPAPQAPAQTQ
jgi:Spy/CpxP family protein refolding chaperone